MSEPNEKPKTNWAKIFSFALILPFAVFLLHLLASYWKFFDYGVNGSANFFGLIFYLPIIFIVLLIGTFMANFVSNRLSLSSLSRILIAFLVLIIFSAAIFSVEVRRMRDYPNPHDASVGSFLKAYFNL